MAAVPQQVQDLEDRARHAFGRPKNHEREQRPKKPNIGEALLVVSSLAQKGSWHLNHLHHLKKTTSHQIPRQVILEKLQIPRRVILEKQQAQCRWEDRLAAEPRDVSQTTRTLPRHPIQKTLIYGQCMTLSDHCAPCDLAVKRNGE